MSDEGMVSALQDRASKLYKIAAKSIGTMLKLNGTKFVVLRPKENSKWKNVFGGSYSSSTTLENDYTQFDTVLIVNLNEMKDVWNRNRDNLDAWTNDDSLEVGDELQYTRNGRTYRFKICMKQGFSEIADSLYQYTLMSIIETLDL